jgi:hypothetical protein
LTDDLSTRNLIIPNKVIAVWTLNNLTSDYENIVAMISQFIRTSQSEINLDDLFSQLIDESRRLKSKEDKEMALNSKASSGGAKPKKNKLRKTKRTCTHCRKSGHNENKCWIKNPSLRPQNNSTPNKGKEDTPEEVSLMSYTETALYSENSTE